MIFKVKQVFVSQILTLYEVNLGMVNFNLASLTSRQEE